MYVTFRRSSPLRSARLLTAAPSSSHRPLGNKIIHPFSDFLLHDVGTGDGIVQNGGPDTQYKLRTPPLWGLRARARFMHDFQSLTLPQAIRRHGVEAQSVIDYFNSLSTSEQRQLIAFLNSL